MQCYSLSNVILSASRIAFFKRRASYKQQTRKEPRNKYLEADEETKKEYNEELTRKLQDIKEASTRGRFLKVLEILKTTGETKLNKVIAKRDEKGISEHLYQLILNRGQALIAGDFWEVKDLDKQIQKQKRKEKQIFRRHRILPEM